MNARIQNCGTLLSCIIAHCPLHPLMLVVPRGDGLYYLYYRVQVPP